MNIQEALRHVIEGKDLSRDQAFGAAMDIMDGRATTAQIGGLLTGLRMKGEAVEEISGFVMAMRKMVTPVPVRAVDMVDTCGTGGDGKGTFNISTVAALVAAGAGCKVAKHGNRSVSSRCGSADLLERLGVNIEVSVVNAAACVEEVGIGFLFAPSFHPAMKHAVGPRKELGIRTIFNILGPLTNPARARRQLLGVYDKKLVRPVAQVLLNLDCERALVVHGADGLDEITVTGHTYVAEVRDGELREYTLCPDDFGLDRHDAAELRADGGEENALFARAILDNEGGARQDIVVLNAAAAIYVAGRARSIGEGITQARAAIASGRAREKLTRLRERAKRPCWIK
jgi:anthranilate phosphoribosyltransferase